MTEIRLFEQEQCSAFLSSAKEIIDFQQYLNRIWANRRFFFPDEDQLKQHSQNILFHKGKQWQSLNYAGFIRYKHCHIHLLPKLFQNDPKVSSMLVFRHLLYYLSYSFRQKYPYDISDWGETKGLSLPGFWISLFVNAVEEFLMDAALYAFENKKSLSFKGKPDFPTYYHRKLPSGQWHQISCFSDTGSHNHPLYQLIQFVLKLLVHSKLEDELKQKTEELSLKLNHIPSRSFSLRDCVALRLPPWESKAIWLLECCKMLLASGWDTGKKESGLKGISFLVSMPKLYEEFIFAFINEHFPELNAEKQSFSYLAKEKESGKEAFLIRNDIFLPSRQLLIETKYKIRKGKGGHNNYGIETNDIYQVVSYALARGIRKILMIYPANYSAGSANNPIQTFVVADKFSDEKNIQITVADLELCCVNVPFLKMELDNKIKNQLKKIIFEI